MLNFSQSTRMHYLIMLFFKKIETFSIFLTKFMPIKRVWILRFCWLGEI